MRFLYVEQWPNGRVYIGFTTNPKRRHRQHIGEISRGSKSVKEEISIQNGLHPEMTILAMFDEDIRYPHLGGGSYEQVAVQTAKETGWNLIYEDVGWPPSRELCIKGGCNGGSKGGSMNTPAQRRARKINGRRVGLKYGGGIFDTPAQQELRRESGRIVGLKYGSTHPRETYVRNGRKGGLMKTPAQQEARREIGHQRGRKNRHLTDTQISEIRGRLASGESCTDVAKDFPVGRPTISYIKHGRRYADVQC